MKKILFFLFALSFTAVFAGNGFDSYKMVEQEKFVIGCGFEDPKFPLLKMRPECAIVRGAGVNGNSGLVIERKKVPIERTIYSILRIPDTVPGITYRVEATIRQEGLKVISHRKGFYSAIAVESNYKDTGKMVHWRDGTTHYMSKGLPGEFKTVTFRFTAKENMSHFIVLKLQAYWTGKIIFDDVKVYSEGVSVSALLNTPSAHSFEPGDGRFSATVDNAPAGAAVRARLIRNGKVLDSVVSKLGKNNKFRGVFRKKFAPGKAELELVVIDRKQKCCYLRQKFPVNILDKKLPVKNTVKIDDRGRTVIDGKPVFVLGLFSDFGGKDSEKRYKRISDAGFNMITNFGMLRQPGVKDGKIYFDNIRREMDKLHKHGLKVSVTIALLADYYRYRIKKLGNVETMDGKARLAAEQLGNHPATLFYYASDEVPREFLDQVFRMREVVNSTDPRHPVMVLSNDPKLLPKFAAAGDIFSPDAYPVMKKKDFRDLKMIETFMAQCRRGGGPLWGTAQSFNWGYFRHLKNKAQFHEYADPTTVEMRAMSLLFVIEGAKGILLYNDPWSRSMLKKAAAFGDSGYPDRMWSSMLPVVKELKELGPYFVGTEVDAKVKTVSGRVKAAAYRNDAGKMAVAIVSCTGKKAEALVTVPGSEKLRSAHGLSTHLGKGVWRFTADGIDSDVLK